MNAVVSVILKFITSQEVIDKERDVQEFYRYGIEIGISSLLNIILVMAIGIMISHFIESIVYLTLFILIRSVTGGYHADTYFRCNLLMCVTFTITVYANQLSREIITQPILIVIAVLTITITYIYCPIENKNKPISNQKKHFFKKFGIIVTVFIDTFGIIMWRNYIGSMIIYTSFLIAILMVAAVIKEKRGENNDKYQENTCRNDTEVC